MHNQQYGSQVPPFLVDAVINSRKGRVRRPTPRYDSPSVLDGLHEFILGIVVAIMIAALFAIGGTSDYQDRTEGLGASMVPTWGTND